MEGMKEIFKKEMVRIFKDKKMVFSVFILPVASMLGVMWLVGNVVTNMMDDIEEHRSVVYIQNEPESFRTFLKGAELDVDLKEADDRKKIEDDILNGKADLLIEFPEQFDEKIADYREGDEVPQIKAYYNQSEDYSSAAYQKIAQGTLEAYRQTLLAGRIGDLNRIAVFTMNSDNEEMIIQDDNKATGKTLGTMLPYFVTVLLFAGAMGIGTDMIAGEKERGTMASLLVSPIKRTSIIFGKVFALMAVSGLSAVISTAAMVVCLPMLGKSMSGGENAAFEMNLSIGQILMLGGLLVALAFLYSTIIALVSVFAKTVKEANSYVSPIYMIVLVVGMLTMYLTGEVESSAYYIPIYNSAVVLRQILTQEVTAAQYGITLVITLGMGLILTAVIAKAFESEKVMSA